MIHVRDRKQHENLNTTRGLSCRLVFESPSRTAEGHFKSRVPQTGVVGGIEQSRNNSPHKPRRPSEYPSLGDAVLEACKG